MASAPDCSTAPSGSNNDLREGPVRLLGYANEVGESFKPLIPRAAYLGSYGVAGTYVAADALWRGAHPPAERSALMEAADTFVWQGLASVAIPGAVINRVVWGFGRLSHARWLPTAAGLACIPFIVKPIDYGVDAFMDSCVRPLYT